MQRVAANKPGSLTQRSDKAPVINHARMRAAGASQAHHANSSIPPKAGLPALHRPTAISQTQDKYEREADTAASSVVSSSGAAKPAAAFPLSKQITPLRPSHNAYKQPGTAGGKRLDDKTKGDMSDRFGVDFSNVRIHADGESARRSKEMNAQAFTLGNDIFFNAGKYNPNSGDGKKLLAHELTHTIQQQGQPIAVQRYEGPEHQDLGNSKLLMELKDFLTTGEGKDWSKKYGLKTNLPDAIGKDPFATDGRRLRLANGLELTPGDVIALMGDFYAKPDDLFNASREEVTGILAIIKKERDHTIHGGEASIAYEKVTKGRYTTLAEKNKTHFSPENQSSWASIHAEALKVASDSAQTGTEKDPKAQAELLNKALFLDAAGGHFLTDAFAAGHLMNKELVLARIRIHLSANPIKAQNPMMGTYLGITSSKTDQFVLKVIHDHFNQVGYEVTNKKGMKWRTFGDDHLKNAAETKHIAALAVFLSRQQVFDAAKGIASDKAEILDLLPDAATLEKATQQAIDYIPVAAFGVEPLIYRNREAAELAVGPVFAPVVRANLNAIGSPDYLKRESDKVDLYKQRDWGPALATQFSFNLP